MATTIYFNGRVTSIPGSYSEVDASGLATINLGASGIVACLGECEGGEPAIVQSVSNPGKIGRLFRSGDVREAGQILFDPSKDPDIPGGAQEVKFVKINPATQSSLTLLDDNAGNSLLLTSRDWGQFTEKIRVQVSDGTVAGKRLIIEFESEVEDFDDIGADDKVSLDYAGDWTADASFDPATGLTAQASKTIPETLGEYQGTTVVTSVGQSDVSTLPDMGTVESSDAGDTTQSITLWGKDDNTGLLASEVLALNGTNTVASAITWSAIYAAQLDGVAAGNVHFEDMSATVVFTIAAGQLQFGLNDFAGPIELAENNSTVTLTSEAGVTQAVVLYGKDNGGADQSEIVILNATTPVDALLGYSAITSIGTGMVADAKVVQASGLLLNSGDQIELVSASALDIQTATLYGLDNLGAVQSENVVLTGMAAATSTGTWSVLYGVLLSSSANGTISVSGQQDSVLAFTLTVGQLSRGLEEFAQDLSIQGNTVDWATASTSDVLLVGTDPSGAPQMEVVDLGTGANGTTASTWGSLERVATGHLRGADLVLTADLYSLPVVTYATLKDWSDFFATLGDWSMSTDEPNPAGYDVSNLDKVTSVPAGTGALAAGLTAILEAIAEALNGGSAYVTAQVLGTQAPANTPNPIALGGGIEGTTMFSHWQAALDLLRDFRINTLVVLTDSPAIHAATVSHCNYMGGPGRSERDCLLGAPSGTTLNDAKSASLALNTRHARLYIQDVKRFNTLGAVEQMEPPFTACVAAGMQAGSSVGTSLTFKYLNILETIEDSSYTIKDDGHELIQAGLAMIEKVPNKGFRWLRNVTTHLIDNNLAYIEASVNEAVNYAVYNFRQSLEVMIGKKGFAGTVTATVSISVGVLGQLINVGAITNWQNLTVELNNDVMTIDVEIAPVIPVNFIKTTVHLVSSSFSAGA
jgi:hypothetical protein